MNHFAATAIRTVGGWLGMARYVQRAEYHPVTEAGEPKVFPSFEKAKLAACDALIKHMNSQITGSGSKADMAKAKAERLFIKGRTIPVEVKRARHGQRASDM